MKNKNVLIVLIAIIVILLGYTVLTAPDQRTTGEKIGDAIDALPEGIDKAAEQLEDRTPGEKLGDAVEDAGEDLEEAGEEIQERTDE